MGVEWDIPFEISHLNSLCANLRPAAVFSWELIDYLQPGMVPRRVRNFEPRAAFEPWAGMRRFNLDGRAAFLLTVLGFVQPDFLHKSAHSRSLTSLVMR
ncbi:MAG: hypothetical protein JO271_01165 [Verrucomicrobia bacterium]|nr:hypothetical protein [Verrucomicrobiota bacterium]